MNIFRKYKLVWIIFLVVVLIIAAGITFLLKAVMNGDIVTNSVVETGSIEYKTGNTWRKSFSYLKGNENKKIKLHAGEEITIKYSSEITKGSIDILFVNNKLEQIQKLPENTDSSYNYKAAADGTYYIRIESDSAKGKYELNWDIK